MVCCQDSDGSLQDQDNRMIMAVFFDAVETALSYLKLIAAKTHAMITKLL